MLAPAGKATYTVVAVEIMYYINILKLELVSTKT